MNEIKPNQPAAPNPPRFDDEIDLVDLALALWRRKSVVIAVALVVTALAAIYAFGRGEVAQATSFASIYSLPTTYDGEGEGRYVIEPGAVMELTQRVFVPKSLKENRQADQEENSEDLEITLDQPKNTSLIVVETEATEAQGDRVMALHDSIIGRITALVESEVDELQTKLDRRIEMLQTRLASVESLAESVGRSGGDVSDISAEVSEARKDLLSAELQKSSLNSGRLVELGQQRELDGGPSSTLIIALGAILGLFAGLFAALMANFVAAARERLHGELDTEE